MDEEGVGERCDADHGSHVHNLYDVSMLTTPRIRYINVM